MSTRHILTIATGKKLYLDLAVNLARSFWLWNANSDIDFYIATDQAMHLPEDVKAYIQIIPVKPGELGEGFSPKLHLDKLAPEGQTLFIDSDCLVYGSIAPVFEKFKGHAVSVVGGYISTGDWFGNIKEICEKFHIKRMPKFNGGIYYLEKGDKAAKVYHSARQLEKQYDEIGFVRLRNSPADEVIMALSMSLNNEHPIPDDGSIMSDPLSCQGKFSTDVIKGKASLYNPPEPNPLHQDWYPFERVCPLLVHFLGNYALSYQYRKDAFLMKKTLTNKFIMGNKVIAFLSIELPMRSTTVLKNLFRPVYKLIFGTRPIIDQKKL